MTDEQLRTLIADEAATKVVARLSKGLKLPDGAKLDDDLLKSAGIPTLEQVRAEILATLKAADARKLIGGYIDDAGREKSSSGYPRPNFSFADFLLAVAHADPRSKGPGIGLPPARLTIEDIGKWGREHEAPRYEAQKLLDLSSGATGGFLVPEYFSDLLLQPRPGPAPCLALATNIPMGNMRTLHFPRLDELFNPDIYWEEFMPGTDKYESDTPEFERPYLKLKNYYVLWAITHDLLKFNNVGIDRLMLGWVASAIQRELDRLMLVGDTGAGDPYDGIINTAGVQNIALLVPGTLSWLDVRGLRDYVPAQYHADCRYFMNQLAEGQCMRLTDGFGDPLWGREMVGVRPKTIDGFPYEVDNQIPNNIGGANQTVIGFGVLGVWFQGNGGQEFGVSEHAGFKANKTFYKVVGYADGFYTMPEEAAYLEAVPVP